MTDSTVIPYGQRKIERELPGNEKEYINLNSRIWGIVWGLTPRQAICVSLGCLKYLIADNSLTTLEIRKEKARISFLGSDMCGVRNEHRAISANRWI